MSLGAYPRVLPGAASDGGGGGTPGGSNGQVQYNDSGSFGGISEGTSGYVLTSNGAGVAPSYQAPGGAANSVTAASAAASSGLFWVSAGADRTASATDTVATANLTTANVETLRIMDTDQSHGLGLVVGSDLSANRTLTLTTGDSNRTVTINGDTTLTGTNTGDQSLFSTIAVSGQSDVVADSTSDTLTLAAGSNITITTNASTDTITIAASGGGSGGYATVFLGTNATTNPTDNTTYYVGMPSGTASSNIATEKAWAPVTGTVTRVDVLISVQGTLADTQTFTHYLRVADTTDVSLGTVSYDASTISINATGLSQAVTAGDLLHLKFTTPSGWTNATNVYYSALVTIQL